MSTVSSPLPRGWWLEIKTTSIGISGLKSPPARLVFSISEQFITNKVRVLHYDNKILVNSYQVLSRGSDFRYIISSDFLKKLHEVCAIYITPLKQKYGKIVKSFYPRSHSSNEVFVRMPGIWV